MTQSTSKQTYCVDIRVGYDESDRESLIELLKSRKGFFPGMSAERGMWQGVKILRVYTTDGGKLAQHVITEYRPGDDFDYKVHFTSIDAQHYMYFLPDLDTAHGFGKFDL